jgi:hypothetical protein
LNGGLRVLDDQRPDALGELTHRFRAAMTISRLAPALKMDPLPLFRLREQARDRGK